LPFLATGNAAGRTVIAGSKDSFIAHYYCANLPVVFIARGPSSYQLSHLHKSAIPFIPVFH